MKNRKKKAKKPKRLKHLTPMQYLAWKKNLQRKKMNIDTKTKKKRRNDFRKRHNYMKRNLGKQILILPGKKIKNTGTIWKWRKDTWIPMTSGCGRTR